MNKRIISLILSLVMAFAMMGTMAVSAFAANSSDTYVTSSVRHTDARNEFTNTDYSVKKANQISMRPKHIYYASDGLRAEYCIINDLNHDVKLTSVDLKISSSQGDIAWGKFNFKGKNFTIHAGKVRVETFRFPSTVHYNKGMNLNTTIHTNCNIEHEDI